MIALFAVWPRPPAQTAPHCCQYALRTDPLLHARFWHRAYVLPSITRVSGVGGGGRRLEVSGA